MKVITVALDDHDYPTLGVVVVNDDQLAETLTKFGLPTVADAFIAGWWYTAGDYAIKITNPDTVDEVLAVMKEGE